MNHLNMDRNTAQLNDKIEMDPIHLELEDIQEEIDYWQSSLICYVIGENPPTHVMKGF